MAQLHHVRVAQRGGHPLIRSDDCLKLLHRRGLLERLTVRPFRLFQRLEPHRVRPLHQFHQQRVAGWRVGLRRDHVPHGLVEDLHLTRLQVRDDRPQIEAQLINERHRLADLQNHELAPALLRNLEESIARHVLHTWVQLVHELEELVDHRLQKFPVGAEKARILADDVHDVGSDDRLVVLAALHLAQTQQIFDDRHQKPLLILLRHSTRDRPDSPTQSVKIMPRPLRAIDLVLQLLEHDILGVVVVQVRKVHQCLAHRFVQRDRIRILHGLPHNLPVLVLYYQYLLRLRHSRNEKHTQLGEDRRVQLASRRCGRAKCGRRQHEGRLWRRLELRLGMIQIRCEDVPILKADLEHLLVLDGRDGHQQVHRTLQQRGVRLCRFLGDLQVLPKETREEQRQILDECLIMLRAVVERLRHIHVRRHHGRRVATHANRDSCSDFDKKFFEMVVVSGSDLAGERLVDGADIQRPNLSEAS
mmetsp:Transcript_67821/g.151460  ORF Transcript_67821/g.151460 Transcript_67821/m.151460 type:complete len:474 (+) Transcript_67821:1658-3079(+)